jgi:hypothetical protein
MNPINALTATNPVGSATSDRGSREQFQQQAKPGQTFTATVLESAGSKRFYLDILGNKILAQSDTVTLSPGTKITLEVISIKPLLELRIISKNPEMLFGKTLTLLGKNIDISGLFQSLITPPSPTTLDQLSPTTQEGSKDFNTLQQVPLEPEGDSAQLKQLLDRLGLSLETLLASGEKKLASESLKAALLEITSLMKQGGELADTTNRLLGTLELYQLAQLRLASENLFIFPLPLPFVDNGYLLVEKEEKNKDEENDQNTLRFSLHLTLEPLGDIEINFLQTPDDGSYIRFGCESQIKKEFINSYQETLEEMISSTEILGLSFTDTAGNPTNDLIQQLVPAGESMLDTKI